MKGLDMNDKSQGSVCLRDSLDPNQQGFTLGSAGASEKQESDPFPSPQTEVTDTLKL